MGAGGIAPGGTDAAGADLAEQDVVRGDAGAEDAGGWDEAEGIPAVVIGVEHAGGTEFFGEGAEAFAEGGVCGIAGGFSIYAGGNGGIEGAAGGGEGGMGGAELGLGEVFGLNGLGGVVVEVVGGFFQKGEAEGDIVRDLGGAGWEDEVEGAGDVGELALGEEEGGFDVGVGSVAGGLGFVFVLPGFGEGALGVFGGLEICLELGAGVLENAGVVVGKAVDHIGGEGPDFSADVGEFITSHGSGVFVVSV